MPAVGQSIPRKEGPAKVSGRAKYVDDWQPAGMLHGATIRSPYARGHIKGIHYGDGIPWHEFTIVSADDIPGENYVALIDKDQPFLAKDEVHHAQEAVLLIAHPSKEMVIKARHAVTVEIDEKPAIFTIAESLACKEIIWGTDNVLKHITIEKGDIDSVWEQAAHIVEGEYRTGAQEQLYIEPQGMIAEFDDEAGVIVRGSLQCPYYVHKALMPLFGFPAEKVRVVQTETGGGFGGKEEYPSMIAGHAALLAMKSGRPVKMIYDRAEDMVATTKRHPSRTCHRTALDREGRLLGMDIDFVIDGGAYATLSAVVLSRGAIHAAGPYTCPHVRIRARAVATNLPPHGAFRGFGAPQSLFATERHMNRIAAEIGLDAEELRRRNFLQTGQQTATSQTIKEPLDLGALLDRAFAQTQYREKRARFSQQNKGAKIKKGIGYATFYHGAGFTGSGEKMLESVVGVEATPEGRLQVLAASTEIGQGTNTIFAQIAADALDLPVDRVDVVQPDTARVPDSGPTVASRTCMVVGGLVEAAAVGVKRTLQKEGLLPREFTPLDFQQACREYCSRHGKLQSFSQYQQPAGISWDDQTYRGDAYATFAWAVYVAEVSVDTVTYTVTVDDFFALQEAGRIIHPTMAAGQIEGGVAQAIGFSLYEDVVWRQGAMANNRMTNYIMPTSVDLPPIRVEFAQPPQSANLSPGGGAKGIGELPMDGGAPAIVNAVAEATGLDLCHVPLMPEHLLQAFRIHRESQV